MTEQPRNRIDLNSNDMMFSDMARKDYMFDGMIDRHEVIKDLKRNMLYIPVPLLYFMKAHGRNSNKLETMNEREAMSVLKNIIIGEETNKIPTGKNTFKEIKNVITLKDIFNEGAGVHATRLNFMYKGVQFISNDPDVYSFFGGYPCKVLKSFYMSKIQLYLNHIHDIICSGNDELYKYVLNWISFIAQNPGKKNKTALLLLGEQGSGKNTFFTDVIAKMFGQYALPNVTKIDDICGRFNSTIENKVFVVCNELQSVENAKHVNSDALKSLITDEEIMYEAKNVNSREGENVSNFVFVSNNEMPLKIENKDRRYCVLDVSSKYLRNYEYFGKIYDSFTPEFYDHLFTFFINRDISKYNARVIPETKAKEDLMNASKESWRLFLDDFIDCFEGDGYVSKDCYADYKEYCAEFGYNAFSLKMFGLRIKRYVDIIRRKRDGEVKRYYVLNNEGRELKKMMTNKNDAIIDDDEAVIKDSI